jgi:hypothetical protein
MSFMRECFQIYLLWKDAKVILFRMHPSGIFKRFSSLRFAGAVLIAMHGTFLLLSSRFSPGHPLAERPVFRLVVLELSAGLVWLLASRSATRSGGTRGDLIYMIAVGVVLRAILLFSTPVLEDDFRRYLWDGAVTAHGHSPYAYAPQEIPAAGSPGNGSEDFQLLAQEGRDVLGNINHPALRTIYPPLAQGVFALAHLMAPWSLTAWRLVLLLFDSATLALILLLLRHLRRPPSLALIYWWCPLLIMQSVNGAHMDVLALPFVTGALFLALKKKPVWAAACIALAAGIKLWPLVLLPFLFRPLLSAPRKMLAAGAVAAGIFVLLMAPAIQGITGTASGFMAYAQGWEMNDALFMALRSGIQLLSGDPARAASATRIITLGLLAGWVLWLARRPAVSGEELAERMLLAVAGLFLLSPAQFPWYTLWMLPLLALRPRGSLLLLIGLMPLYYLNFYFYARGQNAVFNQGIVWLEYVPVWILLIRETVRRKELRYEAG